MPEQRVERPEWLMESPPFIGHDGEELRKLCRYALQLERDLADMDERCLGLLHAKDEQIATITAERDRLREACGPYDPDKITGIIDRQKTLIAFYRDVGICADCKHPLSQHDPEDGSCDAPAVMGVCKCLAHSRIRAALTPPADKPKRYAKDGDPSSGPRRETRSQPVGGSAYVPRKTPAPAPKPMPGSAQAKETK